MARAAGLETGSVADLDTASRRTILGVMAHMLRDHEPRPKRATSALFSLALSLVLEAACSTADRHRPSPALTEGGSGPVTVSPPGVVTHLDGAAPEAGGTAGEQLGGAGAASKAGSSGRTVPTTLDS
jgi:hypothetical protein